MGGFGFLAGLFSFSAIAAEKVRVKVTKAENKKIKPFFAIFGPPHEIKEIVYSQISNLSLP